MKTNEWNEIRDQHENDIGNRLYLAPNALVMKDTTDITKFAHKHIRTLYAS